MRFYCDKLVLGEVSLVLHIIKEGTLNPRISALRISEEKLKPHLSNFNAWFNFFQLSSPPLPPTPGITPGVAIYLYYTAEYSSVPAGLRVSGR